MEPLARRTMLQAAALAAGGSLGTVWLTHGRAAVADATGGALPLAPLSGLLVAWVSLDLTQGASIRIAQMAGQGEAPIQVAATHIPLADLSSAEPGSLEWAPLRHAGLAAEHFATCIAARSWSVPDEACQIEPGRIVHAQTRRAVAYVAWLELA